MAKTKLKLACSYNAYRARIRAGWDEEEARTTPPASKAQAARMHKPGHPMRRKYSTSEG